MANRLFNQFIYHFRKQPVMLNLKATIGSSGAITLDAAQSRGVASITKLATAGQYRIVLQDVYNKLLQVQEQVINAAGISAAPDMGILAASDVTVAATGIVIQFSVSGAAGNLASGDVVNLLILLDNSSLN